MFLKNAISLAMQEGRHDPRRRSRRPLSLALRMALWYGVSTFLLLLMLCVLLYWALKTHLQQADDSRLLTKLNEVRRIITTEPLDPNRLEESVQLELEYEARQVEPVLIRVKDANGKVVVETPGMDKVLPVGSFQATWLNLGKPADAFDLTSSRGWPFRVMTAELGGSSKNQYSIYVACDHMAERTLLEDYSGHLRNILALSIFLCGTTGYFVARRGLRPIERMGQTVQNIKAETLNVRLDSGDMPGELTTLALSFNDMLSRLEDAFSRISRYSSDIAHELRTPLHNLRNATEVALARARTPDEYRDILASCLEECVRLSRLIESLMFIARAENPQTTIQRESVNVSEEVAHIADFYSASASEGGISIAVQAERSINAQLNRDLFQRAVGNLIENAIKYSPSGSTIHLSARTVDHLLQIDVADSGRGIPTEHLPRVFDRFYRVDQARAKMTGGLGLGLAIVQTIAQLHQGKAEIQSQVGVGTRVRLIFPIIPPVEAVKEPRPAVEKTFPAEQWAKPAQA